MAKKVRGFRQSKIDVVKVETARLTCSMFSQLTAWEPGCRYNWLPVMVYVKLNDFFHCGRECGLGCGW
jgi:hypothetical protein